jgi:hypothetical protein
LKAPASEFKRARRYLTAALRIWFLKPERQLLVVERKYSNKIHISISG